MIIAIRLIIFFTVLILKKIIVGKVNTVITKRLYEYMPIRLVICMISLNQVVL